MKRYTAFLGVFLFTLSGCDLQQGAEVTSCAIKDEKLSIAFSDPGKARKYLGDLSKRLQANEPEAVREAADLTARIMECL